MDAMTRMKKWFKIEAAFCNLQELGIIAVWDQESDHDASPWENLIAYAKNRPVCIRACDGKLLVSEQPLTDKSVQEYRLRRDAYYGFLKSDE